MEIVITTMQRAQSLSCVVHSPGGYKSYSIAYYTSSWKDLRAFFKDCVCMFMYIHIHKYMTYFKI